MQRLVKKVRKITKKGRGRNIKKVIEELTPKLRGWVVYFREAEVTASPITVLRKEPAMPATVIDTHLTGLPAEKRAVLEALRERILAVVPDAEEVISYGIPAFRVEGKVVIGFKANKNDYSIYPFSGGAAERFPMELKGRTVTSGSIHFTPDDPISDDLLRLIIQWRIQANRERAGR